MLGEVQQHLRGFREQRERLEATIKQAGTPRGEQRNDIEKVVDSIFAGVYRLMEAVKQGDSATVREMLRCTVERIQLWSEPDMSNKRQVYRLKKGIIHFNGNKLENLSTTLRYFVLSGD